MAETWPNVNPDTLEFLSALGESTLLNSCGVVGMEITRAGGVP